MQTAAIVKENLFTLEVKYGNDNIVTIAAIPRHKDQREQMARLKYVYSVY